MRATFSNSRCLPPEKAAVRATLRLPIWRCATLAGRRGEPPHVFIDVRKPRLDFLTPAALAGAWEAACASTTSAKRCFHEHDYGPLEHPGPPNTWSGRLPDRLKVALQSQATAEDTQGQGSRNRISTLTTGIAHGGDFAPTPIASGTSCREHRPSPCPERRGERAGSPPSRLLAPQTRRKGRATPDFREEVRRSPTRGAFRCRAVPEDGGEFSNSLDCPIDLPAPFSPPGPARETLVQGSGSSVSDQTVD